jgi:hypothetical protein
MFRKLVAIFLPASLGIVMVALVLTVGEIGAEEQGVGALKSMVPFGVMVITWNIRLNQKHWAVAAFFIPTGHPPRP